MSCRPVVLEGSKGLCPWSKGGGDGCRGSQVMCLFQQLEHSAPLLLRLPPPNLPAPLLLISSSFCFRPRSLGSGSIHSRTRASYLSWREGSHNLLAWNERF